MILVSRSMASDRRGWNELWPMMVPNPLRICDDKPMNRLRCQSLFSKVAF
jgi:hypothetical protein